MLVDPSGGIKVSAYPITPPSRDTIAQLEAALRYGWGEPLSLARRGFLLLAAASVVAPSGNAVLVLAGDPYHLAIAISQLCQRGGWHLLADHPAPLTWVEAGGVPHLVAHPRSAPLLMSLGRAQAEAQEGSQVRGDTDVVAVEVPRASEPCRVAAFLSLGKQLPGEADFRLLHGTERFASAGRSLLGGVLRPGASATADFAITARLAALPMAQLGLTGGIAPEVMARLLDWWESVGGQEAGSLR
ncbi:MAG: hypothetical protein ACOYEV_11650 [Candidatus Nanopelagicales bacterium]